MSDTSLGGKQQAKKIESFDIVHWNLAIECRSTDEQRFLEELYRLAGRFGASIKEVGGGPTRMTGRLCPQCGKIIHRMSRDCAQCGAKDIQ